MNSYCRWCGMCLDYDGIYYCQEKEKFLTENTVKSYSCKEFGDCGIDVITGNERKEIKPYFRKPKINDGEQVSFNEQFNFIK